MLKIPKNKYTGKLQVSSADDNDRTVIEGRINGGMVTSIDAADIENNQSTDLLNFVVRYDRTSRRFGSTLYSPTKPNSSKVMLIAPYKRFGGSTSIVRVTPSTVHLGSSSAWTNIVGVLNGGANDRFRYTVIQDRFFFTNHGVDYIQEIDAGASTFARAGNAPRYRYITSFNNRVIGAYEDSTVTPNPIKIGWSGNLNLTEFDPLVDRSAGYLNLIDSATDKADDITGLFGFTSFALLLREGSVWIIGKQPVASNPFTFDVAASGIGCDTPHSAVRVRNGICWFDYRTGTVWLYKLGMQEPEPIGRPVEKSIQSQIDNINTVFASFNPIEEEYTMCIPLSTSPIVQMWTYNFRTKAWWREEQLNVSALAALDYSTGSLVIDDLVGRIDDLIGVINDLTVDVAIPSRFYGLTTGELLVESRTADDDNGTEFDSEMTSKLYWLPENDGISEKLRVEYIPRKAGSFTVQWSKDDGVTWNDYKTKTFDSNDIGKRKVLNCKRQIRAEQYSWRLISTEGLFDLVEYEVKIDSGGESKTN